MKFIGDDMETHISLVPSCCCFSSLCRWLSTGWGACGGTRAGRRAPSPAPTLSRGPRGLFSSLLTAALATGGNCVCFNIPTISNLLVMEALVEASDHCLQEAHVRLEPLLHDRVTVHVELVDGGGQGLHPPGHLGHLPLSPGPHLL